MRVAIATEDELSEACAERLLAQITGHHVGQRFRRDGFGYLRKNVKSFAQVAKNVMPVLLITDLDRKACPATLMADWLPNGRNPNLLFRVAVRSIEAWLLADRSGFAEFAGIAENSISRDPDDLPKPKAELLRLARRSRNRALKQDLLPAQGAASFVGLGYNVRLRQFVRSKWDCRRAAMYSPSLERTIARLEGWNCATT